MAYAPAIVQEIIETRIASGSPGELLAFPYPKTRAGYRVMAVIDPLDEIVLRLLVGDVAMREQQILSDRVFSYRLQKGPPGWKYQNPKNAYGRRRGRSVKAIQGPDFKAFGRTDINSFYRSVDYDVLRGGLEERGLATSNTLRVLGVYAIWQERDGLVGLPVGPDSSGLLANMYLLPVDEVLAGAGHHVLRFSDDMDVLITPQSPEWPDFLSCLDSELASLGLSRSVEKTELARDPAEAMELVNDSILDSLTAGLPGNQPGSVSEVRQMFDGEIASGQPDPKRYRYALRVFAYRRDSHALAPLAANPKVAETDPKATGDYLAVMGQLNQHALEPFIESLLGAPTQREHAVHVNVLRAVRKHAWGRAEAASFERVVYETSRPALVRSWALDAWSRTSLFDPDVAVDMATSGSAHCIRRSAALSLRHCRDTGAEKRCRHVERTRPELRPAAMHAAACAP